MSDFALQIPFWFSFESEKGFLSLFMEGPLNENRNIDSSQLPYISRVGPCIKPMIDRYRFMGSMLVPLGPI